MKVWKDSALGLNSNTRLTCWTYGAGVCTPEPVFLVCKASPDPGFETGDRGTLGQPKRRVEPLFCVTVKVEIRVVLVPLILVSQHYMVLPATIQNEAHTDGRGFGRVILFIFCLSFLRQGSGTGRPQTCYVTEDGLKLLVPLSLQSAAIIGVCQCACPQKASVFLGSMRGKQSFCLSGH